MFSQDPFEFIPSSLPSDLTINVSRQLGTSIQWLLVYRGNDPVLARTALALAMGRDGVTALQVGVVYGTWGTPEYTDIRADITPDGTVTYKMRNAERSATEHRPIYQTLMLPAATLAEAA
jgi:hypothetical protein